MKNTIIFDNKTGFRQGETLTFFLNENLDFKLESKIFSAKILDKIKVFLLFPHIFLETKYLEVLILDPLFEKHLPLLLCI